MLEYRAPKVIKLWGKNELFFNFLAARPVEIYKRTAKFLYTAQVDQLRKNVTEFTEIFAHKEILGLMIDSMFYVEHVIKS